MSNSPFDTAIWDRGDYHAEKYTQCMTQFGTDDVLPMWLADMDLTTPPFILEAIQNRLAHPTLGHTESSEQVFEAIIQWQAQYGYQVKREDIVLTHSVLNGFYMAVQAFTQPDEAVLVQPPIYPPFLDAPTANKRCLVEAPLVNNNNRYMIDFATFEQSIIDNKVKLFLFCHPQNPSGRVWSREELQQMADICVRHDVMIVSDEIHADMTLPPHQHIPMASLSEEVAQHCITLASPAKTFNVGGLQIGYAILANPKAQQHYQANAYSNGIGELNIFAQVALQAAYTSEGLQWREDLLAHIQKNIQITQAFFADNLPNVIFMQPEASYLVWLDFRAYFSAQQDLIDWMVQEAKLGLNDGEMFGGESQSGTGFLRMNLAVAPAMLEQALSQLKQAVDSPVFKDRYISK